MASRISQNTYEKPLSLELLKEHVPHVRAGQEAIETLSNDGGTMERAERNALLIIKRQGSKSQEILILSALPLIKNIASREFQRRKAWSSRIPYDDILQEAIAGFIRGLLSYNENANQSSPTNYLGQWITTSIRRKVETSEHDFSIPYEVVERNRRIRAVQSRLMNESGGTPTDEELLAALNSAEFNTQAQHRNLGRVNKEGTPAPAASSKQKFTQQHLNEARAINHKTYGITSYDSTTTSQGEDESYERVATPLTAEENDLSLEDRDLTAAKNAFFHTVFIQMKMGSRQKDIIQRFFGLPPYQEPQIQKQIISETRYPARFVKTSITAFQTYMPLPGGVFHKQILALEPDEVEALELAWILPLLGDWPERQREATPPPVILTQNSTTVKNSSLLQN